MRLVYVWHDSFVCDMTQLCVAGLNYVSCDSVTCHMTHSYVTWLSHVWHDFLYVTWLIHVWQDSFRCDLTHSCVIWLWMSQLMHMWYAWMIEMNESCVTMNHVWHVSVWSLSHMWHASIIHMNESFNHTDEWIMSHMLSHVTREWVMSQTMIRCGSMSCTNNTSHVTKDDWTWMLQGDRPTGTHELTATHGITPTHVWKETCETSCLLFGSTNP